MPTRPTPAFFAPLSALVCTLFALVALAPAAELAAQPASSSPTQETATQQSPAPIADDPAASAMVAKARRDAEAMVKRGLESPEVTVEPPDGVWLVDEEGGEYFVEKMPRYEGRYKWIGENRIKYLGAEIDLVAHDAEWFYVKVYRAGAKPVVVKTPDPTPEMLAAVRASYEVEVSAVDRLEMEPFERGIPMDGQWRNGFEIADMNGDGHMDIVHGPPRKGIPWPVILLGDSKGNWRHWAEATFPARYDYGDVAVADFNGDKVPDLALGIHLRGVRVLINDGKGAFSEWSEGLDYQVPGRGNFGTGFSSRTVEALDWDGDGRQDLLALGEGPRLGGRGPTNNGQGGMLFVADGPVIFLNQGNGRWTKLAQQTDAQQLFGDDLALGDFNGDGKMDFATSSSRMGRRDLINLAPGAGAGGVWTGTDLTGLRPNGYVRSVTAADFNRDGRDDLAVAYLAFEASIWHNGIDIFYSTADDGWERRGLVAREGREAIYSLDHGDLDGDGALDLVAVDSEGDILAFLGDGKGFFAHEDAAEMSQVRGRCRGYHVEVVDLDQDGRDEVVASFADEANAYFDPDRCPSGGGMAVWKAQSRSSLAEKTPPAP